MKPYKLHCTGSNSRHTQFQVFDPKGANCGTLTVLTSEAMDFVKFSWTGEVFWNGLRPTPETEPKAV